MIDRKNETVTIRIRGHRVPVKAKVIWSFESGGEVFHRVKTPARPYWVNEADLVIDEELAVEPAEGGESSHDPLLDVPAD